MLSAGELLALFTDQESDRVERKESAKDLEKVRQAICAFANDLPRNGLPGVIFVGQKDDLSCAGLTIDDELLRRLANLRDEGKILPFPTMQVARKTINGCTVGVIQVEPSDQPPIRFDNKCWIRVGPRRAGATVEEERRLTERQQWRNRTFDSRPYGGSSITDIDIDRFNQEFVPTVFPRELVDVDDRTLIEKLQSLRLVSPDGVPTASAILMLGHDPRSSLRGAYVQFLRVKGVDLDGEIVDQKEISGVVQDQIRQLDSLFKVHVANSARIGGGRREDVSEYPIPALEQLARNAILHRNYDSSSMPTKIYWFDDRIEFQNAGGLYGEVTPDTIWRGATSYRNPSLAENLKLLGDVDRFGFGMIKVQKALKENGNPPIESEFVDEFVGFTVRRRP